MAAWPSCCATTPGWPRTASRAGSARVPVDYYLDPDEPPGRWWGEGRDAVGLVGDVQPVSSCENMLQAAIPSTGDPVGRGFGDRSARGFDATFSAPKSVSVLWGLSPDPWVRAEVLAAHDTAVDAALGWFDRHGASPGGAPTASTRSTPEVWWRRCSVSTRRRTVDPQLHTHAVISVEGPGPDREVAVARCPVPQVPAAHDRLGLRRRPPHRAHRPARGRLGPDRTRWRPG